MKNITNIVIALVMLFGVFSSNTNAQQTTDENTFIINQYFQIKQEASLLKDKVGGEFNFQAQGNFINLNQIGNNNQINIKSDNSQNVSQIGNNNNYEFLTYYGKNNLKFNISQQGNSNALQIYGENSLINNMSIIQKSNFKTITIFNY